MQSRFDNAPRRFDGVLSCEQHPVAAHGVADQALVCIYPSAAFVAAIELDVPTDHGGSSRLGSHADRDRHALGPELEANGVGMRSDGLVEQLSRRASKNDRHLGRRDRQALARADEKWHAGPPP